MSGAAHEHRHPAPPRRLIGVIDIGTNSLKLTVGCAIGPRVEVVHFARATTRLGEGLERTGRISPQAAARTGRAVQSMVRAAVAHGAREVIAVGTQALRGAKNGRRVARAIGERAGIPVRVLDGSEEATLAYLSACARIAHPKPVTFLIDIGGGSTEFVAARGGAVRFARSVPLGALRLTEKYLHADPIAEDEHAAMRREIDRVVSGLLARFARVAPASVDFVASGGSVTTAVAMIHGRAAARGDARVTLAELRRIEARCLRASLSARRRLPGLPADRADIIPAGLAVAISFLAHARKRSLQASGGGLREGVILALSGSNGRVPPRRKARARSRAAAPKAR